MLNSHVAFATAVLIALSSGLAACDDQQQRSAQKAERGEQSISPAAEPGGQVPAQQAEVPKTGAGPESPPGAVNGLVGTWRLRVKSGADEAQPGITYTFTADGRVTVGPDQVCRYRVENDVLAIDCAGTKAESASGPLKHEDRDHLIWKVGDKTVRLDRQAGVKEQ